MLLLKRIGLTFLTLAAVVAAIYNIDPSDQGFGTALNPGLKYLPYVLSALALLIFMLSIPVRMNIMSTSVCLFIALMLIGSLYVLLFLDMPLEETYLGRALGGIVFIAFYYLSFDMNLTRLFFSYYLKIFLASSLIMAIIMVLHKSGVGFQSQDQMYHIQMPAIIAASFLVPLLIYNPIVKSILVFLLILAGLLSSKASCVLSALFAVAWYIYLSGDIMRIRLQMLPGNTRRLFFVSMGFGSILFIFLFSFLFYSVIDNRLSERGNKVREIASNIRWNEFISSPLFGNGFTKSPLVDIGLLHIPSHSDLLDLLAFGGLVSVVLFFLPICRAILLTLRCNKGIGLRAWLVFFVLVLMLTMAVNPLLSVPRMGFLFFSSLGILFGLLAVGRKETNRFLNDPNCRFYYNAHGVKFDG